MSEMHEKAWGRFRRLHLDERTELRRTEIVEGGFCSRHFHKTKSESFTVLEGRLLVRLFSGRDAKVIQQIGVAIMATPESGPIHIPEGVVHQFQALTDVVAYEFYRSVAGQVILPEDIHRFTESGVK